MKREKRKKLFASVLSLAAFVMWTLAVSKVDVQPIGPLGSSVGFACMNGFVHRLTGVHMALYHLTDVLSVIPLCCMAGFALLGLWQWKRRKSIFRVDRSILLLGGFYLVVAAAYVFFEMFPVHYRPVLIDGKLEASYPSSTTMLVLCVMSTAAMQLRSRIKNDEYRRLVMIAIAVFSGCMIVLRLLSGVHWLADIIGGMLLGTGLVWLYACFTA